MPPSIFIISLNKFDKLILSVIKPICFSPTSLQEGKMPPLRCIRLTTLTLLTLFFFSGCTSPQITTPGPTSSPMPSSTLTPAPSAFQTSTTTSLPPTLTPTLRPSPTPLPTLSGSGGGVIAFASEDDVRRDIYLINADGTGIVALTRDAGWDNWPSWSPDGTQLVYTCRAPIAGQGGGICRINADGSGRIPLTSANDWEPSWSPDGRYIAFASQRDGNPEIYLMNADGTNQRRLTYFDGDDWQAAWSPDSTKIVFARGLNGNWDIYVMDVSDGGIQGDASLRRLTDNDTPDGFPSWSPDGTHILFSSRRDGNKEIYIMDPDGSNQQRLTNNSVDDSFPRWSPDGTRIVFVTATVYSGIHSTDLAIMHADGTHMHLLTRTPMVEEASPCWRPAP
jgi:Tol biopolymer transport system component